MQSYLLKAADEQMARWKETARAQGVSLADFLREAAEAACGENGQTKLTETK